MNRFRTLIPWIIQNNIKQPLINKADGCFIYENKKKIVDFTSGLMVVNLGHNNKYIYDGFKKYINLGISYLPSSFSTYEREKLSDRLIDIANINNGKVFYTNGGADANETAMFLSLENSLPNRNRILSLSNSFHGGSTIMSSIIGGDNRKRNKEYYYDRKKLNLYPHISNPKINDCGLSSLREIEYEFRKNDVSAILLEGSSGSAGIFLYPKHYLRNVRNLCDKYDVILICDEVMSGFGRTGTFFAYQNKEQDIKPDIITCAKGLTSGYVPFGAVIVNERISEYYNYTELNQGLTYFGHLLGCTVANNCLDLYLENNQELINDVNYKSIIMDYLGKNFKNDNELIKDYRTNGFLGGFELDTCNDNMNKIKEQLYKNDIFCFSRNNYIFTAPPLIINEKLLIETMMKINYFIKKY